ncbi:4Fe-4S binding protein [Plebeiibacterium sediminum]|uniref:4Fe-4S binding protein n=1 Tax=Plebeiibacterium sediminum TaxID=2992112 RepID=A0AAE3M6V8_9BACT|nr:4Fe-4S binding protein [Plebeiobacterium sediminum]MCW3788106.1 4Fe-4S binding protein [Plebeiobacterium sediminum]
MTQKVHLVYFSPTNTTKKVLEEIAKGIGLEQISNIDLTKPLQLTEEISDRIVLFGVPVYRGRVPAEASEQLKKIKGRNSKAVLIAVYGNRDYDDALLELKDITEESGFKTIAAATFIGEHSFSTEQFPIAVNRPDVSDLTKAEQFGKKIKNLLEDPARLGKTFDVPGNRPYKELGVMPEVSPVTDNQKCDQCGVCIDVCPTNAILLDEAIKTNSALCILCCACVKYCPNEARYNDSDFVHTAATKLYTFCSKRKEPEFFM